MATNPTTSQVGPPTLPRWQLAVFAQKKKVEVFFQSCYVKRLIVVGSLRKTPVVGTGEGQQPQVNSLSAGPCIDAESNHLLFSL